MMRLEFHADLDRLRRDLTTVQREQMPYATMLALNECAEEAQQYMRGEMQRDFDRPTPFTVDATWIRRATKERLTAEVLIKDVATKADAPVKWLAHEVYGGGRPLKRFEIALRRIGILPPGMMVVPGSGAQFDAFGNMSRGQIVRILSWFEAFGQQGYAANMTDAARARRTRTTARRYGIAYFALLQRRGKLPAGIYQRTMLAHGSAVKPLMIFTREQRYRPRLPFHRVVETIARQRFETAFDRGMRVATNPGSMIAWG